MQEKRDLLDRLFSEKKIALNRSALFDWDIAGMPEGFDFGKVEGMMWGLALGDALGLVSEGLTPDRRRKRYGEIRDYVTGRRSAEAIGLCTDDTQMAYWTLEQMLQTGEFVPARLAKLFSTRPIRGIGATVSKFRRNLKAGTPWFLSGPKSAGNGALMRIAPILIPHLNTGGTDLWVDTTLCAMMTHNDSASTASCLAFVAMLWELLQMSTTPTHEWWLKRFIELARALECDDSYEVRGGIFSGYRGSLCDFLETRLPHAYREGQETVDACNSWYSGAYLLETVPSVLYILMRHGHDPEEAILRAINDTKDNDTAGAIVGAAVGALHGIEKLPSRWLEKHTGRTQKDDDGKISQLLAQARARWAPGSV